ncbi:MoaD/ThiS family protein [Moorella naiadis]|uniref:MoaD/ThiS family protein n=1 Tax=Moorella naiadis (nom. illeg.) TaxID=3093670 RepID=UPI003D9CB54E
MEITVKYYNLVAAATGKTSEKISWSEVGRQGEGITLKEILNFLTRKYGAALARLVFRAPGELNTGLLILADGRLLTQEGGEVLNQVIPAGAELVLLLAVAGG